MEMKVRLATVKDAGILAVLIQDVQRLHAEALPEIFKHPDDVMPYVKDFETRILPGDDHRVYIADVRSH